MHFQKGEVMVRAGNGIPAAYLLTEGWAMRYKIMREGRRQVLDFAVPGDVVGFIGMFMPVADWNTVALTDVTALTMNRASIRDLRLNTPGVFEQLTWNAMRTVASLTEHVVRLGAKNVAERTAHLVLALGVAPPLPATAAGFFLSPDI